MSGELNELRKQTRIMAEWSAVKTVAGTSFAFLILAGLSAIYLPEYTPSSPWVLLGVPVALALLCGWADYRQNTRD